MDKVSENTKCFEEWIFPDIINSIAKFSWNLNVQDFLLVNKKVWSLRDQIFLYEKVNLTLKNTKINPLVQKRLKSVKTTINSVPENAETVLISEKCKVKKGDLPFGIKDLYICAREIEEGAIPESVNKLGVEALPAVVRGKIPNSVNSLCVVGEGDDEFDPGIVPESVKELKIFYFGPITGKLPPSVKSLELLGVMLDENKNILPDRLEKFEAGCYFENEIFFPKTLKKIVIDKGYPFSLTDKIPDSVTELVLECYGKTPLGKLPSRLEKLVLDSCYNHPISLSLPETLVFLELGEQFDEDLICPKHLQTLRLVHNFSKREKYEKTIDFSKCKNLKTFYLEGRFSDIQIPKGVENLELVFQELPQNRIPNSVINLCIKTDICIPRGFIPPSVKKLKFGGGFNQPIQGVIPYGVEYLEFSNKFDKKIGRCIPSSVAHLIFGSSFDQPIDKLPKSVTHLSLGSGFQRSIIPETVTHLEVYPWKNTILPKFLKVLKLGRRFIRFFEFDKESIPKSLAELCLDDYEDRYHLPWVKKVRSLGEWKENEWG